MGGMLRTYSKSIEHMAGNPLDNVAFALDPGGLVYTSENKDLAAFQGTLDVGGYGAKGTLAEREAKANITSQEKKQKAIEAKQQALIDKEQKALDLAADERKTRMAKRDLLFGSETGITGNQKGSLLS